MCTLESIYSMKSVRSVFNIIEKSTVSILSKMTKTVLENYVSISTDSLTVEISKMPTK